MIVKRPIAEALEPMPELLERPSLPKMRYRHFDTLQEIKGLEGQPVNIFRMAAAILIHDAEQVSSHVTQREVPADVGRRQLLGERGAIESREHPLRKFIRKSLRKEVVAAQAL